MNTKALRQKILDLAIHGKLVPQDPNDEPASVLLDRIRAEKERLIKEGKLKKPKKSKATCDKQRYPFELPEGWAWCKLRDIVEFIGGYAYKSNTYVSTSNYQVVRIGNVKNDFLNLENQPVFVPETIGSQTDKYKIYENDILFTMTGTKGKRDYFFTTVVKKQERILLLNQRVGCLRSFSTKLDMNYLSMLLKGKYILDSIFSTETGNVSQGNIGSENTLNLLVALPPYVEQQRIVKKVNSFFDLLSVIEERETNLQDCIQYTKSKILDLAIHGKLVPQDPNDEPAAELLKRINPKAEIICDNPQYGKPPKGWCLTEGKHLYKPMKSTKPKGLAFNYVDIDSIDNTKQRIDSVKVVKTGNAPSRASRYTQKGDIVFSMVRPYLKNIAIVTEDECIASTGFYVCSPSNVAVTQYCYYLMISDYTINGLNQFMKGDNSPSINKSDIDNWGFPLPPLSEQHRIVTKIEELFAQLDKIEASL